ncbi:ABC transporter substrate-binding protein [Mycolicibacterium smegmatis]|jgi:peptide/nickel transport system substrate-binding protein|uniref:ABC transporter substrate-binding protein n=1 Tax=Mycolicibacterium smegmatis TaxID=1772 RepID=UPI0005D8F467|nr:ABC transporter substrate-binding protein [Mycolicibacterium smegmatis]MCP2624428.1 ABC transporter substrate-binding protein [Mycolicibacterium smegmatis]MDF1898485.1 ABC transporter substrate-binding protein [Mycolicibacterium smegmatis]MDF1908226.1 ABC transporter substrate-binding protein [Mycolicibacterium smegmatis]MDF1915793.1 ABC transporter substrate-binding protein [Mycolicibacterium smegmatis]MDF1926294.1 ABC transporter substrate-binding protein [Mycolicibacterium smegmatis]
MAHRSATARARAAVVLAVLSLLAGVGLTSCGSGSAGEIDYAVDGTLTTYNTNTVAGAASSGPQAFARTLTGFAYHGPDGQVVADHDFGTMSVVGRAPLVLDYVINDNAVYSDGKPITCDDMVLTWAAQSGRFPGFDSASRAGYRDIGSVDCEPGQKRARVSFAQDRGFLDYGYLFAATSLMPSHVIADELGLGDGGVVTAFRDNDLNAIENIAKAWNTIWDLKPDIDLKRFPSSGPYRLDSVSEDGSVVLVANDKWWGTPAITPKVTVWPRGADIQERVNEGSFDVVDIATGSSGLLNLPDDYVSTDTPSAGIEQLIFAPRGPLGAPDARRAVALCTPRDVIARNAEMPIANARLSPASEDAFSVAEGAAEGGRFSVANPDAARDALDNRPLTVRIGYQTPNARLAAIVGAIAKACAPAGITVQDAGSETAGPIALRNNEIDALLASTGGAAGAGSSGSSAIDAYTLHVGNGNNLPNYNNERIDGIIDALAVTSDPKELARLLGEGAPILWNDVPTLPLYRQQRTVLTSNKMYAVSGNPTRWGAGWNMDRWKLSK